MTVYPVGMIGDIAMLAFLQTEGGRGRDEEPGVWWYDAALAVASTRKDPS